VRYVALERGIGRLEDGDIIAVLDTPLSLADHLAAGGRLADLDGVAVMEHVPLAEAILAPLACPSACTWGVGLNYWSKREATGRSLPERPTLFTKAPSAAVPPGGPIRIPASAPACVDYEGEIAVILSAPLFEASPDEAESAVGAVAAANDVTARDVMRATGNPSLAKSYPGFGQLGSAVLDPKAAGGFDRLTLTTLVNHLRRGRVAVAAVSARSIASR
jgi:2-keto-4-pentenoate hydratase/2-oxohepta-3-ene-1,7-dioic acid hydratase in catechol pathway